jgi:serine protease Do
MNYNVQQQSDTMNTGKANVTRSSHWAALGLGGLIMLGGALTSLAAEEPKLRIDPTPVPRDGKMVLSFAPMIKQVAPSVVTITSTKVVKQDLRRLPGFFDDPFWRRFFGFGEEDDSRVPPRRREFREYNLGSGVIVSPDGYILSNHHVVEGADELKVSLANSPEQYAAKVVGTDALSDIAVLKIEGKDLPAITLTDSDNLQVGDIVLAIGNPFGVGQTVTMGIVSGLGRSMGIVNYEDFIQTDASINPGNSGGALVDIQGRLVGINTAILSRTGGNIGVGFAVPINMARYVMQQLIQHGKVARGYLGVVIQPVTPQLQKHFKLPDTTGALVGEVNPDSPAAQAGIKEGDVIIEFNGRKVPDNRQLRLMVAQTPPKTKVTLKLLRDGKEKTLSVTLGELPPELAMGKPGQPSSGEGTALLEGVELADLDTRTRRQAELPTDLQGVLVTQVEEGTPASEAGLRPGDVIVEINHEKVASVSEALALARKAKGKSLLLRVWSQGARRYLVIEEKSK